MWSDLSLGPSFKGQTRIARVKSAYNSLIIGPRVFGMVNQPVGNHGLGIFLFGRFDLGSLFQGQTRIARLKSAYNSLIISPRGSGW